MPIIFRNVQFLRSTAVALWRHNRRIHRHGRRRVASRPMPLLSAAESARQVASARPPTASAISTALHAFAETPVQADRTASRPTGYGRPSAGFTADQGIPETKWRLAEYQTGGRWWGGQDRRNNTASDVGQHQRFNVEWRQWRHQTASHGRLSFVASVHSTLHNSCTISKPRREPT